jgi:hypothetical protein
LGILPQAAAAIPIGIETPPFHREASRLQRVYQRIKATLLGNRNFLGRDEFLPRVLLS